MKKMQYLLMLLASFVIFLLVYRINPYLFSKKPLTANAESLIWNVANFSHHSSIQKSQSEENSFFYRGNLQRRAFFEVPRLPKSFKKEWISETFNIGVHSASKASPMTDGSLLFVGADSGWFYAFTKKGEVKWKFYLGKNSRGIHSTAAVDDHYVYVGSYRGALYKIEKNTGRLEWMRIVGETIGASPLLDGRFITLAIETLNYNGYLIKMDKYTGEIIWRTAFLGEQSHSSPALSLDKKILSLGANNNIAFGIDYLTGEIKWRTSVKGKVKSTPIVVERSVFFSTKSGELFSLDIYSGVINWEIPLASGSQVSPTYLEKKKLIIAGGSNGTVGAFDFYTGRTIWKKNFLVDSQMSSPIIIKNGSTENILVACANWEMCYLNSDGKEISRLKLGGRLTSSPLIWQDSLYVSLDEGGLEAYSFIY